MVGTKEAGTHAKLSAVVVTKNEAYQIRQCLENLRFADEIVVVDTGSTDRTVELARGSADQVFEFPRRDGELAPLIHAAKNFGFERAAGPWILSVDADERVSDELKSEILALLDRQEAPHAAYALPFTHYFFGKYLRHGGFRGALLRLFVKGKLSYPEDRAHSTPLVDGSVGDLKGLVVHFNHPTLSSFVQKMDLYTSQDASLAAKLGRGGLRNRPVGRLGLWSFVRAPLGVFWNRYVRHRGFRDGAHGLVAAAMMAAYQFVETAKLWESKNVPAEEGR